MTFARSAIVSVLCLAGCRAPIVANHAVDEAKIRQLDAEWVKAAATHSADAWDAYYADDAVVLPPNEEVANTGAKIKASMTNFLAMPGLVVTWEPTRIVVGDAGDMAYVYGSYKLSAKDPAGKPVEDTGKIAEVWRKRPNGEWKCVLDTWNTSVPLPS